jgi:C4-dicarboxylate-specific signal transduction histidine kinase
MMNQNPVRYTGTEGAGISLYAMVDLLVRNARATTSPNNVMMNEVPEGLVVEANEEKLAAVMHSLLSSVLDNARNGEIHITAEKFRDIVILEIQDRNNYNGYALGCRLKTVEPEARRMGGDISVTGQQQLVATISFSFPNQAA